MLSAGIWIPDASARQLVEAFSSQQTLEKLSSLDLGRGEQDHATLNDARNFQGNLFPLNAKIMPLAGNRVLIRLACHVFNVGDGEKVRGEGCSS